MRAARTVTIAVTAALLGAGLCAGASAAAANEEVPVVTGPITGGMGKINLTAPGIQVAPGYVAEEYFISGTATAYAPDGRLRADGKWKVERAGTAPYTTRIVVYRPADAAAFNGTVFVEWLNVSAGFESAPDWGSAHTYIARAGAAWVGVSTQAVGVQGGQEAIAGVPSGGLKAADPERYAQLSHPGDAYSYDIFTQAGRVAAGDAPVKPLGDLDVQRVIAVGESQSAFRLVTYVNAIHPRDGVYDGFLIHSRGGSGSGFTSDPDRRFSDGEMPKVARIRKTDVPVLTFQTETDLFTLDFLPARQKDAKWFRLWEVAGTSHADAYTGVLGFNDNGDGTTELTLLDPTKADGGPLQCSAPINSGPAFAVLDSALFHLDRWVRDGTPPPKAKRLAVTRGAERAIARDEHGNAKGGVRTPLVDVPVATLTGEKNEGGSFCALFGTTEPFDAAKLAALYPTHEDYVQQFDRATKRAVAAGFLLPKEAKSFQAAARAIAVPPTS
jgi:hypothetical protein